MPDSLWKIFFLQIQADPVRDDIGERGQAIQHAENEQDRGVKPQSDTRIAFFDFVKGRPGDRRPFSHDFDLNAPAPARVTDILTQLAQGPKDRDRKIVFSLTHM